MPVEQKNLAPQVYVNGELVTGDDQRPVTVRDVGPDQIVRVLPARLPESIRLICYGGDPHPGGSRWARVSMGHCRRIWCEGSAGSRRGGNSESRGTRSLNRSGRSPSDWPRPMASVAPPPCFASI